ncbi:unnamed protein product, partial [Lymnaea stagnalis]
MDIAVDPEPSLETRSFSARSDELKQGTNHNIIGTESVSDHLDYDSEMLGHSDTLSFTGETLLTSSTRTLGPSKINHGESSTLGSKKEDNLTGMDTKSKTTVNVTDNIPTSMIQKVDFTSERLPDMSIQTSGVINSVHINSKSSVDIGMEPHAATRNINTTKSLKDAGPYDINEVQTISYSEMINDNVIHLDESDKDMKQSLDQFSIRGTASEMSFSEVTDDSFGKSRSGHLAATESGSEKTDASVTSQVQELQFG